jgi:dolichol-phosphate mannosyltransferase
MHTHATLVFIPTYNEKENILSLYAKISSLARDLTFDLLFLDDNSPDGTGQILDQLAKLQPHVKVIHRQKKFGIGSAHLEGIQWAYRHGYTTLITMDCDFTHAPEDIPKFIRYGKEYALVIGSRFLQRTSLKGWNLYRKAMTFLGHLVTRYILSLPYDATAAFRLYRLDMIPQELFSLVGSTGYAFFFESLYVLNLNRVPIYEFPINLPPRT